MSLFRVVELALLQVNVRVIAKPRVALIIYGVYQRALTS